MAEPVQCLSDGCHKPASPLAKGDQSQYDTLFLGESASPALPCSPSSQTPVSETALRASSVSTADEVTASSSSTPSSEGTQDHIEGLLQRLPDINSLNQKSLPYSVAGTYKRLPPGNRRTVCAACRRSATVCCELPLRSGIWHQKIVEKQSPPAADFRLFKLSARQTCSDSDAWAFASLTGRCAILLVSSPRALSCVYVLVSIVTESCRSTYIVRCTVVFDKSLLRICLFVDELCSTVRMSDIADVDTPQDPVVAGDDCAGGDPPGGALYTWPDDNRPAAGGEPISVPPLGPMTHHPGRARTHPGQPRVPFPPAGFGLSRQPRAILGMGDVVPRLFGGGGDAWVRPRMVNPPGEGVPSGVMPVTLGQPLTPRMGGGELLPVLVDPAYGGSSGSDTAPSMASMRGALAMVRIEDVPVRPRFKCLSDQP